MRQISTGIELLFEKLQNHYTNPVKALIVVIGNDESYLPINSAEQDGCSQGFTNWDTEIHHVYRISLVSEAISVLCLQIE